MTHWFFSPHPDDAELSCGGQIATLTASGERVVTITLFCGDLPKGFRPTPIVVEHHKRWGFTNSAPRSRRKEDKAAAAVLGAVYEPWHWPEALYRVDPSTQQALYTEHAGIFGDIQPSDRFGLLGAEYLFVMGILDRIAIGTMSTEDSFHFPLGVGHHVDHQITSQFAYRFLQGVGAYATLHPNWKAIPRPDRFFFYEEFPYTRMLTQFKKTRKIRAWQREWQGGCRASCSVFQAISARMRA